MNKKAFIQQAATTFLPFTEFNVDKAINWAERLWERLGERGYGAPQQSGPRASEDWLAKLSPDQRTLFLQFWTAFGHKHGRNGAAMRWLQLDPSSELAGRIIEAAKQESLHQRQPGETRKHAQGWLQDRRWEDYDKPSTGPINDTAAKLRELRGDLASLKALHAHNPDDTFVRQIADKEQQIRDLQNDRDR